MKAETTTTNANKALYFRPTQKQSCPFTSAAKDKNDFEPLMSLPLTIRCIQMTVLKYVCHMT